MYSMKIWHKNVFWDLLKIAFKCYLIVTFSKDYILVSVR